MSRKRASRETGERRLHAARREDGRIPLGFARWTWRRPGRHGVGTAFDTDLRIGHEPSPSSLQADERRRPRQHDDHGRLVGRARSVHGQDPLADRRSAGRDIARVGSVGVWDLAPVAVANGVLYASSMARDASQNQVFALDARTGTILWQLGVGSSVNSGPAVVDGTVYWGSGYARSGVEGSGNTKLLAFSIDGK
jgi:PQQ enzyme-like repeat protein